MTAREESLPFRWIGGRLCLDFNNTIDWCGLEPSVDERLPTYDDLLAWATEADVLPGQAADRLRRLAERHPQRAGDVLNRALALRAAIHTLFFGIAAGGEPHRSALAAVNAWLAETPAEVHPSGAGSQQYAWAWAHRPDDLAAMLPPVAWSAAQLLTSAELSHVKTCSNDTCGWLFLDESRKHNRRWCEMRTCGNRAKARRFYERRRSSG